MHDLVDEGLAAALASLSWSSAEATPPLATLQEILKEAEDLTRAPDGDMAECIVNKLIFQLSEVKCVCAAFAKAMGDRMRYKKSELRSMAILQARQLECRDLCNCVRNGEDN